MRGRIFPIIIAAAALIAALLACSLPTSLLVPPIPVTPTTTPQIIVIVATPTPAPALLPGDTIEARRIAIYQRVAPAVVNITTQVLRTSFFRGAIPEEGSGSGFLWDRDGHIVTNYHVVEGAQKVEVSFGGDAPMPAKVIGADPLNDLAVIKVDTTPVGVEPLDVGQSADLKVGQTAIAIGNPFGQFERTMTQGIISALNRTIETDSAVLRGVIQTDAAINRGNSGGPLLDSAGRLIGVNSAIYSPTGTSAGVGLAIPVDKVKVVVPVLITAGHYPHPWLGIEGLGYELSATLARTLGLATERGLLIGRMYQDSPADRAGLQGARREQIIGNRRYLVGGDIVIAVDGRPMTTWESLNVYLEEQCKVGQTITLTIIRDGREISVTATLADTPE